MNLGLPEMLIVFFIALILFGPKKLPEIGKTIGRAMNEFRRATDEFKETIEKEVEKEANTTGMKDDIDQIKGEFQDLNEVVKKVKIVGKSLKG